MCRRESPGGSTLHGEPQAANAESGETSVPCGRAYQLVFQYQIIEQENIHTNNIIQPEQVVVMYLGICMHIHMSTINEKRAQELESNQGREYGGLEEF